jgi:hypothetical protein
MKFYFLVRKKGITVGLILMQVFQDALMDCELEDIDFSGDKYTWNSGIIREGLDRAVAN